MSACALGERLQDVLFMNAVVDAIIHYRKKIIAVPGPALIASFYEATADSCPTRHLFADMWAFLVIDDWLEQKLGQCPRRFLEDLTRAYDAYKHRFQLKGYRLGAYLANVIKLPVDRPEDFKSYSTWLYGAGIISKAGEDYLRLARSYVFAEKIIDPDYQKAVPDAIITTTIVNKDNAGRRYWPGPVAVRTIYKGTANGSPARRLLVDMWVRNVRPDWNLFHGSTEKFPVECINDLLMAFAKYGLERRDSSGTRPWVEAPDSYHVDIGEG
ncbi:hypothetical protein BCR34DRAFT_611933 [Clohesyomyces aquaticus]|uniref:Uncharacterized protein n=1 Tax=Clohesyomyces aquaticus TaxID=1231657 RepID=A0A1Y2A041_9PLEO|nr:hypothetical protein BCR34DRAFT_611933 [Clohesyomyces aquaticus]